MLLTNFYDVEDSDALVQECLIYLKKHLKEQGHSEQIINSICDLSFINDNPSYYVYYPYLFNSIFEFYDEDRLKTLSVAGFLYYKSIIYIDDIFDNKESKDVFYKFTISNICQEETIKLLSSIFQIDSDFWKIWNKRKSEYFKAYQLDKVSHNIKTFSDYEKLADYKSSFGKIAIDSLHILTNKRNTNKYHKILKSHKFYYVAFQILDDISDYEEDAINGQFNISRFQLAKVVKNIDEYNINDQKKLLYIKNVASNLYHKSLFYLDKSFELSKSLNAVKWKSELQMFYNTVIIQKLNVNGFIKYSRIINNKTFEEKQKNTIENAIGSAENYIINEQETNGQWEDFFNNAGLSNVWSTSFITYILSKNDSIKTELQKSKEFILSNMYYNKFLWGYNSQWIPDADSTSFGMLALNSLGYRFRDIDLEDWYLYQNNDGGFSTYKNKIELIIALNDSKIKNVDGWLNSHFCVSSVAYLVFSELKINNKNYKKLRNYILENLKLYSHQSYWWTSSYYSLSFLIIASSINNDHEILSLCSLILNKKMENNSLPFENEFYLGLLINALSSLNNKTFDSLSILNKLVSRLLKTQKKDGSWKANYSLRMPSPQIINPNSEVTYWEKDIKGTNILVKDFHRLFTTATCLSGLDKYKKLEL